ncbi:MAG: Lin0512 family protein [Pseudomonadota bacterium]
MSGDLKRIILEMGTGNDLYGRDYTKAACRAVQDAIHHSSLTFFRTLDLSPDDMQIALTIAAQEPEAVDCTRVAQELPYGTVTATAVSGGINVHHPATGETSVIVNVAIDVRLPL